MNPVLKALVKNRRGILKAEIGSLLFNLGKTHIGFWKELLGENRFDEELYNYGIFTSYKNYVKKQLAEDKCPFDLDIERARGNCRAFFDSAVDLSFLGAKPLLTLNNFVNGGAKEGKYYHDFVCKIMFSGCENVNSGIDKGGPKEELEKIGKKLEIVNAFGGVPRKVDPDHLDGERIRFLEALGQENFVLNTHADVIKVRLYIMKKLKGWYSQLLSDSRYPINDITLWDQAYMTASLFKAALAALALDAAMPKGEKQLDYYGKPRTIQWSILGVQYDKLGLAEKAMKPGYIRWYRQQAAEADRKVKKVMEEDFALGNEIYRDETGIYFVVPENILGDGMEIRQGQNTLFRLHSSLKGVENKIVECFCSFNGEVFPAVFLTKPSRGTMNIAYLLENAKDNFLRPVYPSRTETKAMIGGKTGSTKHICDICGIRMAETAKQGLHVCGICEERNVKRSTWEDKGKETDQETIWTGELQDKNGKIALTTVKFELGSWLNGDMVNTLLVDENYPEKFIENGGELDAAIDGIRKEIDEIIKNRKRNITKDKKAKDSYINKLTDNPRGTTSEYLESLLTHRTIGERWEKLLKDRLGKTIKFDEKKIAWEEVGGLSEENKRFLAEVFVQFIIRKNPSPARFRRIWESTERFLKEIKSEWEKKSSIPPWRKKRLRFRGVPLDSQGWDWHGKEFEYQGLNFIAAEKGEGDYLELITSIEQAIDVLRDRNQKVTVKEIRQMIEKGDTSWLLDQPIELWEVESGETERKMSFPVKLAAPEYIPYKPFLSIIEPTPVSWQFILPAEYAPEVIELVKRKYEEHFSLVKGKLALHVGVVVQDYKRPLYIGIKALRNIRRDVKSQRVIRQWSNFKELEQRYGIERQITENAIERKYYGLLELKDEEKKAYCRFHLPDENAFDQPICLDVPGGVNSGAEENRLYAVYPNTFDFQYMDVNVRRNDICYGDGGQRKPELQRNRPYLLEDWQYFQYFRNYFFMEGSAGGQSQRSLQNIVNLIYAKLKDWDGCSQAVKSFMLSSFVNLFGLSDQRKKDEFAQIFGLKTWEDLQAQEENAFELLLYRFLDMYDLWHTCMGNPLSGEEKQ